MPAYAGAAYAGAAYAGPGPATPTTPPATATSIAIQVQISFTGGPFDPPTWTDVTSDVDADAPFEIDRGYDPAFDDPTPGTLNLTLRNADRRYDPLNTTGPHYGQLKTRRRIRVNALVGPVGYTLFDGYIRRWPQRWNTNRGVNDVRLACVDLLGLIQDRDFFPARPWTLDDPSLGVLDANNYIADPYPTYPELYTGTRLRKLATRIGVPDSMLDIDRGHSVCAAGQVGGGDATTVGEEFARINRTELGELFVNASGVLTFVQRHGWSRRLTSSNTQVVLSDDLAVTTAGPYVEADWDAEDRQSIVNDVTLRLPDGRERSARALSSQSEHGRVSKSFETLHHDPDLAGALASWLIRRFAQPQLRINQVVIDPRARPNVLVPAVCGLDLGARVRWVHRPTGSGTEIDATCRIVRIRHNLAGLGLRTSWRLVLADLTPYWTLDHPTLGLLDATNEVAP